jgi:hypothetical protein
VGPDASRTALGYAASYGGWSTGLLWSAVPALLSVAVGVISLLRLRGRPLPDVGLPWPHVALAMSSMLGYLVVVRTVRDWATVLLILGAALQVLAARESTGAVDAEGDYPSGGSSQP